MNLRVPVAEQPFSGAIIHEDNMDKILFGSMQIKTFQSKLEADDADDKINKFLSETPKYVMQIQTFPSSDGMSSTTRIIYRSIDKYVKGDKVKGVDNAAF